MSGLCTGERDSGTLQGWYTTGVIRFVAHDIYRSHDFSIVFGKEVTIGVVEGLCDLSL